jgi:thiol-disulfide isomerase/thioredoxin
VLDGPLLLPPILLATLLIISGVAKLRAPAEVASAFAQLRLPAVISGPAVRRVFPWAEIVLAVLLLVLPGPTALPAALAAVALMLVYLAIIVRALGFGYPITCGCFGRLGLGEVTRRTAVRNALLVALSLLVVWSATAERSVLARLAGAHAGTWLWLGLLALTVAIVVVTFGGAATVAPAPLPSASDVDGHEMDEYVRRPIPEGHLEDAQGDLVALRELAARSAHLLVFVSPTCGACREIIPQVGQWEASLPRLRVRAVVGTPIELALAQAPELDGLTYHDPGSAVALGLGVDNPGAVLLGMDGLLAGGPVSGSVAVQQMVAELRAELQAAGALPSPAGE